jgi:hypothetical protein
MLFVVAFSTWLLLLPQLWCLEEHLVLVDLYILHHGESNEDMLLHTFTKSKSGRIP